MALRREAWSSNSEEVATGTAWQHDSIVAKSKGIEEQRASWLEHCGCWGIIGECSFSALDIWEGSIIGNQVPGIWEQTT